MISFKKGIAIAAAGSAAIAGLTAQASTAGAASAPRLHVQKVLSSRFVGPLQFAVGRHIYVADSFQSALFQYGKSAALAHGGDPNKGGDIAGVAIGNKGSVAYTSTEGNNSYLTILAGGKVYRKINLSTFEKVVNPDGHIHYGLVDQPKTSCAAKAIAKTSGMPAAYYGQVDSHPYSVTYIGHGNWAVADAGGNDVLKVTYKGGVSILNVPPRQVFVASKTFVKASHLPSCVIGVTYWTESVPTDVEQGPDGQLYITTLPGGPDGAPGIPPRGAVWKINPSTHQITLIKPGLSDPNNLAVNSKGHIYVAQLGNSQIVEIVGHHSSYRMTLPGVAALEIYKNVLYATTAPAVSGAHKPGQLLRLTY